MENSPLNLAHQYHRKADNHIRYLRFDEAIQCHIKAAECITEAMNTTNVSKALESLKLQYEHHVKQQNIIRLKKEQLENYKKAVENHRKKMADIVLSNGSNDISQEFETTTLQIAIYKTMEEADSLLGILIRKGESDIESLQSEKSDDKSIDVVDSVAPVGSKRPKDEKTVIEELRTLNQQLHSLIFQLVTQLDASMKEADALRSRVKFLEDERSKMNTFHINTAENNSLKSNHLKVTDSSGGTSPFVFSPCSEFGPEMLQTRILPILPPLEMPNFDFDSKPNSGSENGS